MSSTYPMGRCGDRGWVRDGVEVGTYDDFHRLRTTIAEELEVGQWGGRFPVFMNHPDSDGTWTAAQAAALARELEIVGAELAALPPLPLAPGWPEEVGRELGLRPANLLHSFIDVDGEPLVERLLALARQASELDLAIWFQ